MIQYNNPAKISYKDFIAAVFLAFFFYVGKKALILTDNSQALDVLDIITEPVLLILGGYFLQEGYSQYTRYKARTLTSSNVSTNKTTDEPL